MVTDIDVARVVRESRAGRPPDAAFQPIYERYFAPAAHFFANRGFSEQEAKDLAQDALLRVYRSMGTFRGDASLDTWVFRILRNVGKNARRDREAQKRAANEVPLDELTAGAPGAEPFEEPRDPVPSPLDGVLAGERVELLRAALETLPPKMREVALLRMQEYKYREIAATLQVSMPTVKSQLANATARLRPLLAPHFDVFFLDTW